MKRTIRQEQRGLHAYGVAVGEDAVAGDAFAFGEETGDGDSCLAVAGEGETVAAGPRDAGVLANSRRSAL